MDAANLVTTLIFSSLVLGVLSIIFSSIALVVSLRPRVVNNNPLA